MTNERIERRHRWRRAVRRAGISALAAGLVSTAVAVYFVVFPTVDPIPKNADVAFVLGPPTPARVAAAYSLHDRGVVDSVLISLAAASLSVPYWKRLCSQPDTACGVAHPYTTQGEARLLKTMAAQHGWRSAVAITQSAHISRARLILQRCFAGPLAMRPSGEAPPAGWGYEVAYQVGATAKAVFVDQFC